MYIYIQIYSRICQSVYLECMYSMNRAIYNIYTYIYIYIYKHVYIDIFIYIHMYIYIKSHT